MAALLGGGEVPLEVHLPQRVRRLMLEALPGGGRLAGLLADAAVALQHAIDSADRQLNLLIALQDVRDLARPPGGVCVSHGQHPALQCRLRAPRAA
jgi:hypothetical protein